MRSAGVGQPVGSQTSVCPARAAATGSMKRPRRFLPNTRCACCAPAQVGLLIGGRGGQRVVHGDYRGQALSQLLGRPLQLLLAIGGEPAWRDWKGSQVARSEEGSHMARSQQGSRTARSAGSSHAYGKAAGCATQCLMACCVTGSGSTACSSGPTIAHPPCIPAPNTKPQTPSKPPAPPGVAALMPCVPGAALLAVHHQQLPAAKIHAGVGLDACGWAWYHAVGITCIVSHEAEAGRQLFFFGGGGATPSCRCLLFNVPPAPP